MRLMCNGECFCVSTHCLPKLNSMAHKIESIDVELIDKSILLIQQNWMSFQINGVIDLIRSMWTKIYSSCSFSTVSRGNARKIGGSWHSRHNNVLLMHANCIDLYESYHVKSTGIIEYESIAWVMSWIESESVVGLIPPNVIYVWYYVLLPSTAFLVPLSARLRIYSKSL